MPECLFCQINRKGIPATVIYEDDLLLAFRDINPQAPIHFLVIPKQHIATVNEAGDENEVLFGRMMLTAQRLAKTEGIAEAGFRLVMNCNRDGGQTVYHLHLHVLGGRSLRWPPG